MSDADELGWLIEKYPEVKELIAERDRYKAKLASYVPDFPPLGEIPPGHFYSPVPSLDEVRRDEARLFGSMEKAMPGIDLREDAQLGLLEEFAARFYGELPFQDQKSGTLRYYFDNPMFGHGDAIMLYSMIRYLRPRRIVEVGSGFSSALALDTNDLFLDGRIHTTFIEPYNERLLSLLSAKDKTRSSIIETRVQDVDLKVFAELEANDILFIDSTHVSKIGSDVNRIFFEILPALAKGVVIHFHDIFLPFDYPPPWVYGGLALNEAYMLRTFLQFNQAFEIMLANAFLGRFHGAFFDTKMPLFMKNTGGSFWIRKIA